MDLVKDTWNKKDVESLDKFLYDNRLENKIDFTKNVVNTNMDVLGIPIPKLREIAKDVMKGNYISYLDNLSNKYYESTIISALCVNKINETKQKEKYLKQMVIDNWSTVDILRFKIKGKENEYLAWSKKLLKSKETFIRRIGVRVLFEYTEKENLDEIFSIIDSLKGEEEYYVNMALAWLMCELVIKNRDKTFEYLKHHNLNDFTINKTISKCRDSFRVSAKDKEFLLKYKVK